MRILELENRCTGNRTVGSNPTLSANEFLGQVYAGDDLEQNVRAGGVTNLLKRFRIPQLGSQPAGPDENLV